MADNPVFGFDYASSMDVTNLAIGLDHGRLARGDVPDGTASASPCGQRRRDDVADLASSRIIGWKDFVNQKQDPV